MIHFTRMVLAIKWKIAKIFWRLLNGVQLFLVLQQSEETGRASCRLLKNCSDSETTMKSTTMCCLNRMFSFQPNKARYILKYKSRYISINNCPSLFAWKNIIFEETVNSKLQISKILHNIALCPLQELKLQPQGYFDHRAIVMYKHVLQCRGDLENVKCFTQKTLPQKFVEKGA